MCWAFSIVPSELDDLIWCVTFKDIQFKIKTQMSVEHLRGIQTFQAVAEVVSAAFGGKKKDAGPVVTTEDQQFIPKSGAEAVALFNKVMMIG